MSILALLEPKFLQLRRPFNGPPYFFCAWCFVIGVQVYIPDLD